MARTCRSRNSERQGGQVLVVMVIALAVLIGFTGLATDGARASAGQHRAQTAADAGALAAIFQLNGFTRLPLANDTDLAVTEAQESATLSGFPTRWDARYRCQAPLHPTGEPDPLLQRFDVTFYDQPVSSCPAVPANFTYSVEIEVPAEHFSQDSGCNRYAPNCVEVAVTYIQQNLLGAVIGQPRFTISAVAVAMQGSPSELVW